VRVAVIEVYQFDELNEDAKEKAREIAHQLGVRLGEIVNFQEQSGGTYPPLSYKTSLRMEDAEGGNVVPEIAPGKNKIQVNVSITYELL